MIAPFCRELYTIENIEPLYIKAKERLNILGYSNIYFNLGDGTKGLEEFKPFDRIMVTAAAKKIPQTLIDQLAPLGRMIIPAGDFIQYLFIDLK